MGRRALATFGVGVTAGAAAYAGLTTGVLTGGLPPLTRVAGVAGSLTGPPAAAAVRLDRFDGCEELRRWYVRAALPEVGPWGLGVPSVLVPIQVPAGERATTDARTSAGAAPDPTGGRGGTSGTGTNVQDRDVDESDVAKTDGRILARVTGRTLVVTDVSGSRPRELSRTTVPGPAVVHAELLLHGTRVLVVGDEASWPYRRPVRDPRVDVGAGARVGVGPGQAPPARTRLVSLDLTDATAPRVTDDRTVDGSMISTREYADGTVRLVLSSDQARLHFVQPGPGRSPAKALQENRRIVKSAPIDAWLPQVAPEDGPSRRLVGCADVRHPSQPSGFGTLSVVGFPFGHAEDLAATAVTAAGDLAYSSADRVFVATSGDGSTEVHAFALDGARTRYVGSGSVSGTVEDRWSLDEYDGHLRVAATGSGAGATAVTVLEERGDRLVRVGSVEGLGKGEELESVRWLGRLAVLVTFHNTDPLYTLDLTDPARPRVLGVLKAPGFSSYLHPVGPDLLVGLGHDATATGADLGAQVATFDLRDLQDVRRTDTLALGRDSEVGAEQDPRAFTYLPDQRTLITPVQSRRTGSARFVAVHVSPDGRLSETGSWVSATALGGDVRALSLGAGRVALVDDEVRVVRIG